MPNLIELRPDRALLDPEFNGYKLSLERVHIDKKSLIIPLYSVLPTSEQYSFLHAKLFGLHNHLTGETSGDFISNYFIDRHWHVQKLRLNVRTKQYEMFKVWEVPNRKERRQGDYNMSIKLATEKLVSISDGMGNLYILDTGVRNNNDTWTTLFSDEVIGAEKNFVIQDVICKAHENRPRELHCLLLSVEREVPKSKFLSTLYWVTLSEAPDKTWGAIALRRLAGSKFPQYCSLEPSCEAVYIVSDTRFKFIVDSENPITVKMKNAYKWIQNRDKITLKFEVCEGFLGSDVNLQTATRNIFLKYKDQLLLCGRLCHGIDNNSVLITATDNLLEITLTKLEKGLEWAEVVEGDHLGELIVDQIVVEDGRFPKHLRTENEMPEEERGISFSSEPVEECNFKGVNNTVFERICSTSHKRTHLANIGSGQVILTAQLCEGLAPALAIRHDVDACLWQPRRSGENWTLSHEGTLFAFGYVQASKQQRKFSACAPNFGYSVICDSNRHIFVYHQNKPVTSGELRNRTTGTRVGTVAQQQVINIGDEEVFGIYATNSYLFLLTENCIMTLHL